MQSSIVRKIAQRAAAKFPLLSDGPTAATLKQDGAVTFDPLGVAAVLHNPRASSSAAKLYVQYDRGIFSWPHTTMIGSTLPPMQMLVGHLAADVESIHPAVKMCSSEANMIAVRSDISSRVFRELPMNLSNIWLTDVISFGPSRKPGNDFMVVYIDAIHEDAKTKIHRMKDKSVALRWRTGRLILDLIMVLNGAMIWTAAVLAMLTADFWAFTLFFLYGIHWVGSTLLCFTPMVQIQKPASQPDPTIKYAAYQRREGGTVIFKGPQDKLEEWARSTWEYKPTVWKTFLHCYWMITGSLSAIAALACMVNMRAYMQLSFLAILLYASCAEIVATKVSRMLQILAKGPIYQSKVLNNDTRSQAIIRATLEIDPICRLEGFDWIKMGLLPSEPVWAEMQKTLALINKLQRDEETGISSLDNASKIQVIETIFSDFLDRSPDARLLAERIVDEMRSALKTWFAAKPKDLEGEIHPELKSAAQV